MHFTTYTSFLFSERIQTPVIYVIVTVVVVTVIIFFALIIFCVKLCFGRIILPEKGKGEFRIIYRDNELVIVCTDPSASAKNVGVAFDYSLNFRKHIGPIPNMYTVMLLSYPRPAFNSKRSVRSSCQRNCIGTGQRKLYSEKRSDVTGNRFEWELSEKKVI